MVFNKQNAMISKIKRNEGLRLIPTDIIDEAIEIARETIRHKDAEDPSAAKKKVLDSFSELGIKPNAIKQYLGHNLEEAFTPAEVEDLRGMYRAIKDGETTWRECMEKSEAGEAGEKEGPPEVDQDAIKKFDSLATEGKADPKLLNDFLAGTAKVMELTVDQLKVAVVKASKEDAAEFWDRFTKHCEKEKKRGKEEGLFKK